MTTIRPLRGVTCAILVLHLGVLACTPAGVAVPAGTEPAREDPVRPAATASEPAPVFAPSALAAAAPAPGREFRGMWVASVGNMDWPSRSGLTSEQQQAELRTILDRAAALHMNAIILQVRPAGDALYASKLEPWSEYLTGASGVAPQPFYDPLEFAVREAHARGLELHAWFNPYRARYSSTRGPAAPEHITNARPDLVRTYGPFKWMDPGEAEVRRHTVAVIADVVRRYDIDGVHIDDYFYPYRESDKSGRLIPFPDERSWDRYVANGGTLSRADWRRENVNGLVQQLYRTIKAEKPWVKFGISPFGIWRPGHPASVVGLDSYVEIFADSRKWLQHGWLDYIAPQLYWPAAAERQGYTQLLRWWVEQNAHDRHVWPGNHTGRVASRGNAAWSVAEILKQVRLTRDEPGATGNVHFGATSIVRNVAGVGNGLREHLYAEPALVPASPWLGAAPPAAPALRVAHSGSAAVLELQPAGGGEAWLFVVRTHDAHGWRLEIVPGHSTTLPLRSTADAAVVSAISRTGIEGPAAAVRLHQAAAPRAATPAG